MQLLHLNFEYAIEYQQDHHHQLRFIHLLYMHYSLQSSLISHCLVKSLSERLSVLPIHHQITNIFIYSCRVYHLGSMCLVNSQYLQRHHIPIGYYVISMSLKIKRLDRHRNLVVLDYYINY